MEHWSTKVVEMTQVVDSLGNVILITDAKTANDIVADHNTIETLRDGFERKLALSHPLDEGAELKPDPAKVGNDDDAAKRGFNKAAKRAQQYYTLLCGPNQKWDAYHGPSRDSITCPTCGHPTGNNRSGAEFDGEIRCTVCGSIFTRKD